VQQLIARMTVAFAVLAEPLLHGAHGGKNYAAVAYFATNNRRETVCP
jgi:hypothetical protein